MVTDVGKWAIEKCGNTIKDKMHIHYTKRRIK